MMNGTNSLFERIPKIRRTREFHVYDFSGNRFLDLWLDGGRAFLGHKYGRSILMMKNSLEKGLSATYRGVWEDRLLKHLKLLYPQIDNYSIVFAGKDTVFPIFRPFEGKPFIEDSIFELLLPAPGSSLVKLLCCSKKITGDLPPSSPVPQYLYSGICRSVSDLIAFSKSADVNRWKTFDATFWERRGPWLFPVVSKTEYEKIFLTLLKAGIILSPYYNVPSCAPYSFTDGEIMPIKKLAKEY